MSQIGMKKGLWVNLDFKHHHVAVHCSVWSGKEVVYVDNHPVSEKRNLTLFASEHAIEIDGEPFLVNIEIENPFTLKTEVRIKKGARTLSRQSNSMSGANISFFYSFIAGFIVIGGLTGYLLGKLLVA